MKKPKIPTEKPYNKLESIMFFPFSRRFRNRFEQRNLPPELQNVYRNTIMTGDRKLLLIKNSKAGCTSLASLLIEYSTGSKVPFNQIHLFRDGVFQGPYDWKAFDDAVAQDIPLVFSFVRNPIDRLVSCFFDFFVSFTNGNTNEHIGPISQRGFSDTNSLERNFEVFVDYVAESISEAPEFCNRHWREQTRNLGGNLIKINFVGKLESYGEDIREVFRLAGEQEFIDRQKGRFERLNASRKERLTISKSTDQKIRRIYSADYERFGYD